MSDRPLKAIQRTREQSPKRRLRDPGVSPSSFSSLSSKSADNPNMPIRPFGITAAVLLGILLTHPSMGGQGFPPSAHPRTDTPVDGFLAAGDYLTMVVVSPMALELAWILFGTGRTLRHVEAVS